MTVEDPNVIDFVAHDPTGGVVLVMVEGREWDGTEERLHELQEKINSYATFVQNGQLLAKYPEFTGKPVRIELRCVRDPDPSTNRFLDTANRTLRANGLSLSVKTIGTRPTG